MSKAVQILEKIAKEKHHKNHEHKAKVNPMLIAGIPLAAAGALSLPGSLPAARMALRQLRDPLMNVERNPETKAALVGTEGLMADLFPKKYLPQEFVSDYIESGHGLGKTPYKGGFKAFAKHQAKVNPSYPTLELAQKETAEHYDKFTGPEREGLLKWLDEVRVHNLENMTYLKDPKTKEHVMHEGKYVEKKPGMDHSTSKKMVDFGKKSDKLKALIAQDGDVLSNIRNTKDEDILDVLKMMHAQKAGVGQTYGKAGLAGVGMTAADVGLTGAGAAKYMYDKNKEQQSPQI